MNERITTCGIVIKERRVLVAKRSVGEATNNLWEFVGGKNRWGESEEETLVREFSEELGIKVRVGEYLCSSDFVNKDMLYHLKAYRVYPEGENFTLSVHSEIRYADKDELFRLSFVPSDRSVIEHIISSGLID
ncbi:MAG: (deoxy)nucleoside triphosphate pyrophosphohydrolase [Bullifex sp.]